MTSNLAPVSDSDSTLVDEEFDHHSRLPQAMQKCSSQAFSDKFSLPMMLASEDKLILYEGQAGAVLPERSAWHNSHKLNFHEIIRTISTI